MAPGYLSLVLHWHLPFVRHPEYPRFLEEDWLFEAITDTYIPLLSVFKRLREENVPFRLTISISPTLSEMLGDKLLLDRYLQYLSRMIELTRLEIIRTQHDPLLNVLAKMYQRRFQSCRRVFEDTFGRNLLAGLLDFQKTGHLDLITTAATHCFLPLFQVVPQAVKAQIEVAVQSHVRTFGSFPRGFWLPECGYYPGVEDFLKEYELPYFFVESHGILYGERRPRYGVYAPVYCPNRIAAFARDPESARTVWSADEGYPGDPVYRDFYRDIGFDLPIDYLKPFIPETGVRVMTGIKYHAVTGPGDKKRLYSPKAAGIRARMHAEHFLADRIDQIRRLSTLMDRRPLIVCPFDAELFGHWWFEGTDWLEILLRGAASRSDELAMITPGDYLGQYPEQQISQPCFSSWGNKGYAEVWLDGSNDWVYRHLHEQALRMSELVRRFQSTKGIRKRALDQAMREMLLAEASDWAFIMKTGTMVPYAVRRTREHINNFFRIYDSIMTNRLDHEWLSAVEARNNIFSQIDYTTYSA